MSASAPWAAHTDTIWIARPLATFTGTAQDGGGGLVISAGRIVEVVPTGAEPSTAYDTRFDAGNHVLLPGLVNAHHHFYQTLTRAVPAALNKALFPWLKSLYPIWANLTSEHVEVASTLALAELMLSGCTTASDHHYVFNDGLDDALDRQAAAGRDLGIRLMLTRGSMSLGESAGGLPPDRVVQDEDRILAASEAAITAHHDPDEASMCRVALAPCSPFSVTEDLMRHTATLARRHSVRLHTHLAETEDENAFCKRVYGRRPLALLEDVGWLGNDVWLAHGIHFDEAEIARLGAARVGVCHCPSSNMVLGSGTCPVPELTAAGVPVGLGVDGAASNDCSNLIQEVRQALMLQRLRYGSAAVTHEDVLGLATAGSAATLGWTEIGTLEVGKRADLAMFRLDEARFSGAGDPLAALVMCGAHRADRVMVEGRWRVVDGTLPGLDLEALIARHRTLAADLLARHAAG